MTYGGRPGIPFQLYSIVPSRLPFAPQKHRSDEEEDFFEGTADGYESEDGLFTGEEDNDDDDDKEMIPRKSYDYDPDFRPEKKKYSSVPKSRPKKTTTTTDVDYATPDRIFHGETKRKTLKLKNVDTPKSASLAPSTSSEAHRSSSSSKYKDKSKDKKARKMKKGGRGVSLVDLNFFYFRDSNISHTVISDTTRHMYANEFFGADKFAKWSDISSSVSSVPQNKIVRTFAFSSVITSPYQKGGARAGSTRNLCIFRNPRSLNLIRLSQWQRQRLIFEFIPV